MRSATLWQPSAPMPRTQARRPRALNSFCVGAAAAGDELTAAGVQVFEGLARPSDHALVIAERVAGVLAHQLEVQPGTVRRTSVNVISMLAATSAARSSARLRTSPSSSS